MTILAELFLISEPEGEIKQHVIFIHGLDGHYNDTWKSSVLPCDFWPTWLCDSIKGLSVWSIGYEACISRWKGTAMHLTDRAQSVLERILLEPKLRDGELIFIGHSLGGLLVKQLLRDAESQTSQREEVDSLIKRTRRIAFLGTPHAGSGLASLGDRLRIILRPSASTGSLLRNDPNLRDLNKWYRKWSTANDIEHLILIESKPYHCFGMIVKPDSADPGLPTDAILVDEDHDSISKPDNKTSEVFLYVQNLISKHLQDEQILWIKEKFGQTRQGWRSYENWANCPDGIEGKYLSDDDVRFFNTSIVSESILM